MQAIKRALVTGISGFTGYYVAKELEDAGFEVHGLGVNPASLPHYHQVDLTDPSALTHAVAAINPNVVIHLAGLAFVAGSNGNDFYHINTIASRNLLEALVAQAPGIEAVLLASSANIYGNKTEGKLSELTLPDPANDYAVSKLAMEYMARLYQDRLPIMITRPFNYTGAGQANHFLIPKIVSHFARKEGKIELGNMWVERDFSDVRIVAKSYAHLIQKPAQGEIFNICSENLYSLKSILGMMAEIAGYEIEAIVNPAFVRKNEIQKLQGDAGKLRKQIQDLPVIPLQETLQWMYQSMLASHAP